MALKGDPYMRVCGVVSAGSVEELAEAALKARAGIVELRIDRLRDPPPKEAAGDVGSLVRDLRRRGKRVVVTLRDAREGGYYRGSQEEKARVLLKIAEYGPDYLDVEVRSDSFDVVAPAALTTGVGLIASLHHFKGPLTTRQIVEVALWVSGYAERLEGHGRAVAKVVYSCSALADELHAMQAIALYPGSLISFAMGGGCILSRLAAPFIGAPFTYAHEHGGPTAPGQPSVEEVMELWRRLGLA